MAFELEMNYKRTVEVNASFSKVFDTLADVPYCSEFFPTLEKLTDLGDEKYKWEMEKIGLDRWSIETVYTAEYFWEKKEGWVEWTNVKGGGNAEVEGRWDLEKISPKKTKLTMTNHGKFELNIPKLAKVVVAPIAKREYEKNIDAYIDAIVEHLEE